MRKNPDIHAQWAAVIGALCLLFIGVLPVSAQEAALGDSVPADTLAIPSADSLNADPEWYVAPEIPVSLRAPKRATAAAASCTRVEAIQTFNIDSVLTEGTYYEYDAKGNVISTTVWTYNPDGTMTGKSKNEYAFDAAGTQTMTAVYIWDGAANDWKGTEKYEYVYKTFAGEKKMISNTSSVWLNGAWVADQRFTYDYDASLREISYFEYRRNTSTNELQPVKGREQSWTDDLQTLEALYTAYANGKWTAGTKKEWAFDGNGTQTMYATYTISNGAWVGSSKETWAYNTSSKLTLHEKYGWAGNDWSITLQENTTYDASGNTTLIENYSWSNGIKTGTKKEQYSFDGGKPVLTMVYAWSNGAWIGSSKEVWNYNASSKLTLHEKYGWTNNDWSLTLQEKTVYSGANITLIENYTWSNGVKTGTKKEEYTYSGSLKTSFVTYSWAGSDWVGASKEIWAYTSSKLTLHETYAWETTAWTIATQENTTYTSGKITRIENYEWVNGVKTGTQKEEYVYTSGVKTETIISSWANNDWVYSTKKEAGYREGNTEVSEANYTWNGTSWVGSGTRIISTYNSKNFITEILRQDWPEGATDWVNSARAIDTFNDDGVNIMTYVTAWNGSAWRLYSMTRTDIIKDEAGRELLNASWSCESDSIWKGVKKDTAAYTATGKPLYSASYKAWANGDWVPYMKGEYTYDDAGRQVLYMQYDGTNGVWVNKAKTEQAYDAAGNQILLQGFNWSNNAWVGVYKYEYAFDAKGRQTMQAHYEWSSGRWSGFSRSETEYDAAGNVSASISFKWKNNAWVGNSRTENVYDAKKRVVEYTLKKWQSNKWVNSRHTIYVYDSFDRLVSTRQYWWYNNEWTIYGINDATYDSSTNVLRRELSASWMDNELDSYSDNYYYYDCDPHFYTVRFVNYDGQVLANMTAQEGETPVYPGETPIKAADTENTYTFAGWTPAIAPATANVTYTATYTATPKAYTVTWKNEDGSIIKQEKLEYGTTPAHADITKESTAEWTYTFAGWTPGIGIVTGDAEYTATFTQTKNSYLITFQNEDGTVLSSETYEYGAMPTIPTTPTKPADSANTYTFAGWDKEIAPVTESTTYTATYNATKNSYTVTWLNSDNSPLAQTTVAYGETPVYTGEMPSRPNTAQYTYTFVGWSPEVTTVTGEATYTATYDSVVNSYTITWKNEDGTQIDQTTVEYGTMPVAPSAPTKQSTAEYTYTFSGWTPTIAEVTGDATYTATFTETKNKYLVTFKDENGTTLKSEELEYGVTPVAPEDPTKGNTAEYSYTFSGWDKEVVSVTEAAIYTATYAATKNSYTITWKNEDGSVIASETLEYGATPAHADITKENTAEYTYTFAGWTPTIAEVTGDATYTASFTATKNKYLITFKDEDGTTLKSEELEYGVTPVAPEDPTKGNTAEYTYAFNGWDKEVVSVTEAATYTATYNATKNSYTITFADEDGTVLQSSEVEYGAKPTAPSNPTKANAAEWSYTFTGWTPQVEAVTGDAEYTATFTATKNTYTITWLNEDGSQISQIVTNYGEMPTAPADPTKAATAEYTYTFAGWTPAVATVTGDAEYKATFTATKNTYTITWLNEDGSVIESQTLEYGATPTHADITKESTAEYTYTFAGWTPAVATVTGDAEYKATFTATKNIYTITWKNEEGSVIESQTLEYGATPTHADITKESTAEYTYTFSGWTPAVATVTGDATYTATFTATERVENKTFTITFYYEDGVTVLDQVTVKYGETPSTSLIPSKYSEEHYYYSFAGWSPEIVPATGDASYTATYRAIPQQYTVTFKNYNGRILLTTNTPYGEIPVYAGETPAKPKDKQYTYTFSGWSPELTEVTGPATYTAVFEGTLNQYTVLFLDEDGTELDRQAVDYGAMPVYAGETPQKEEDEQYRYTFKDWSPKLAKVTKDATYRATYTRRSKTEGLGDVKRDDVRCTKVLIDGQIYILRGGKTYTLQGMEVNK